MTPPRELFPTASGATTRRAVIALLRPHRVPLLASVLVLVAAVSIDLTVPALLGRMVDAINDGAGAGAISGLVLALVGAALGHSLLRSAGEFRVARLGETALAELRENVVDRALALPLEDIEKAGSGDLVARVSGDVSLVAEGVREAVPSITESGLTIGLTIVGLGALDYRFALAGLAAAPIQMWALRWYLRRSGPLYRAQRVAEGERTRQLLESLGAARTVRALRLEAEHRRKVEKRSEASIELAMRAVKMANRFFGRLNYAELVGLVSILLTGFLLLRRGAATIGAATAAALYFHRIFDPINILLSTLDEAQNAGAALARLVGITAIPLPPEPADPQPPQDGSISIRGLRHAYTAGHEILKGIDLEIRPGARVALVGASGAGKTTLSRLVAGIHVPTGGTVAHGGVSVSDLGTERRRRRLCLVTQEVHVFAGPLIEDLRLGKPAAARQEVEQALERVGATPWVNALPEGVETVVGEAGHRLTPTQAQQVALARVLLKDPAVIILDEATAEAGSAGARALEASAAEVIAGRTSIVVAHRLSQSRDADLVVVLDGGRVVESGTHRQLAASGGSYARSWEIWSSRREAKPAASGDVPVEEEAG